METSAGAVLVLTTIIGNTLSRPFLNEHYINPEENINHTSVFLCEGDIKKDLRRNAVRDLYRTWLNRTVPYVIDPSYNEKQRLEMQMAMAEFMQNTCVSFKPHTTEADYIRLLPDGGCSSSVGRKGGKQDVSIGADCDNKGTIMHELMHALGFWHEHSRPDRDEYITIMWSNIAKEHETNFRSYPSADIDTLGAPYDYGSIMHYRNNTFALDRSKLTIRAKQTLAKGVVMGQRERLSDIDILKINRLYRCNITHCPDAGIPKNGRRKGDDFRVSMTVEYGCNSGYTLVGSSARFCMDLGEWTGNFPSCLPSYKGGSLKYCNFDGGTLCEWKQDRTDEQDWIIRNRSTPSDGTGPKEDHTMATPEGYYLYLESSDPSKEGYRARLISPTFRFSSTTRVCLVFSYNMNGETIGTLNVYQRLGGKNLLRFTISGDQGLDWKLGTVVLENYSEFEIVFDGVRGSSYRSDIAIDDILVGACDSFRDIVNDAAVETASCDFNGAMCGWLQLKNDDFDWSMGRDQTPSVDTGPDCDPTDCQQGQYMYTEASSPRLSGDVARFASPMLKSGGPRCMSFSYHMYGQTMGMLSVFDVGYAVGHRLLWARRGNQGRAWHREQIDIPPQSQVSPFQLVFEGLRGDLYWSDIAIDNVEITKGTCADMVQVSCTFEHDWCGWTNAVDDDFDWTRHNGSTWTPSTGPTTDHTNSSHKFYAYIESSTRRVGSYAKLVSPRVTDQASGYCLEFWYHMYGRDVRTLSLLQQMAGGDATSNTLWTVSRSKDALWRMKRQYIRSTGHDFKIVFHAVVGGGYGDIAIDDISIKPEPCYSHDARVLSGSFPFLSLSGR